MNKPFFKYLILAIIIVASVFLFLKNTKNKKGDPWKALPNSPVLLIEINNTHDFFQKYDSIIIEKMKLGNIVFFKDIFSNVNKIKSLIKDDENFYNSIGNATLLVGVYHDNITKNLFIVSTDITYTAEKIKNILSGNLGKNFAVLLKENYGSSILKIVNLKTNVSIFIGVDDNLLLISKSEDLIIQSIETYESFNGTNITDNNIIKKVKKIAGKKVDAKIYVKNSDFYKLLPNIIDKNYLKNIRETSDLAKYTETDLLIRNNEIIFNGMALGDSSLSLYNDFTKQKPQPLTLTDVMPYNTNLFINQGFSNFSLWVKNKNTKCGIVNTAKLIPLIGNEIAFANTATQKQDFTKKSFLIIKIKDRKNVADILNKSAVNKNAGKYDKYVIGKLKNGIFVQKLFGEIYGTITENYYTFVDDNLVLANNIYELQNFLRSYETGKTLDLNENFKEFSENLTETSNFTVYAKTRKFLDVATRYLSQELDSEITANKTVLSNFEAISLQLSSQPPYIYTNLFIKYEPAKNIHEENLALWKVKLDNEIVKKPYPVFDHTTRHYNYIIFDKSNNVYLIRTDGTVLWKKELDGLPLSDVKEVDYYKNGKIQYLFNTKNKIYLIDRKGRYVKGYPLKISPSASNGLAVFDYNKRKDYRILLGQSDKRIYNYTIKGEKVKGWNTFKMPEIVLKPAQHLVTANKDYIIVTDLNKNIKIVNRRGQERIKLKNKFKIADNSIFYVNKTNSKGIFLTTDESGKLVYITTGGRLNFTDFGKFTKKHFFLYEDFNGDGSKDFIYVDENKLRVFDRFKKLLFKYDFNHIITIKPSFFQIGYKNKVLGIVVAQEKTIYLFDKRGNIIINNGLVGEIPFTVVNSKNNREINLITGAENVLFNYRIR